VKAELNISMTCGGGKRPIGMGQAEIGMGRAR